MQRPKNSQHSFRRRTRMKLSYQLFSITRIPPSSSLCGSGIEGDKFTPGAEQSMWKQIVHMFMRAEHSSDKKLLLRKWCRVSWISS